MALMLVAVTVPVLVIGTFAPSVPVIDLFTRFTPQLAVGFTRRRGGRGDRDRTSGGIAFRSSGWRPVPRYRRSR